MSSFTKFLVVLLTVFSVFLCGIVVTYVASANNWKAEYEQLEDSVDSIKKSLASEKRQANEQVAKAQEMVDQLTQANTDLKGQLATVESEMASVKRENRMNLQSLNDSTAITEGLRQTIEGLRTSLEAAQQDLVNKTKQLASATKKLNELNTELDERIVEVQTLEVENKKLLEIKSDLEDVVANKGSVASVSPVTSSRDNVTFVPSGSQPSFATPDLKARISEVDLRNKLATINIGMADGVNKGMRFHITRGNQFVGDIVITHVDQERAAGVLELVQVQPMIGDNVSLNL